MALNVGINVTEVEGRATPSIQPAPTSVAAFIIRSERGVPGEVFQVTNWSEFIEHFGSYRDGAYGAYALRGFLDNGGTTAYVTRVVRTGVPVATNATLTSRKAPWRLHSGDALVFESDGATAGDAATFSATPATLSGSGGPFDFSTGSDHTLSLSINGVVRGPYEFKNGADFADWKRAQAAEVAAVLNREFPGIQAWIEGAGAAAQLRVRTDRRGSAATVQAAPVSADPAALGVAGVLGLVDAAGEPKRAQGTGNVLDIDDVTAAEAASIITGALDGNYAVTEREGTLTIKHPVKGAHTLTIGSASSTAAATAFAFDAEAGNDGSGIAVAEPAHATCGGLTVWAGYCGFKDPGAWGNKLAVRVTANAVLPTTWDVAVRSGDQVVATYEQLRDALTPDGVGVDTLDVINDASSGSKYVTVETDPTLAWTTTVGRPEADENGFVPLTDGQDDGLTGSDLHAAIAAALPRFDTTDFQLLCCPESTDDVWVAAAVTYCAGRGDCFFVGHTPASSDVQAAALYGQHYQAAKRYGAVYFPWIRVADPRGKPKLIPPTGHILGMYARTDAERGVWKAPAGNAAELRGALSVATDITDVQHTYLVKNASVNAVRYIPGTGIVVDSSRTLSTDSRWLYINVRLLMNMIKTSLKTQLRWAVQEPNDEVLWAKINHNAVRPFLLGLWRRGAFGPGAPDQVFTIKVDKENNPPAQIQQGILTVEVSFYPSRPAETISIKVGQQDVAAVASEA